MCVNSQGSNSANNQPQEHNQYQKKTLLRYKKKIFFFPDIYTGIKLNVSTLCLHFLVFYQFLPNLPTALGRFGLVVLMSLLIYIVCTLFSSHAIF